MIRTTYTYVLLDVSENTYNEIYQKLKAAEYNHCFHESDSRTGIVIDMHGLALVKDTER